MSAHNTALEYVYRDLDGFELKGKVIVQGPATPLQIAEIKSCLDGEDRFSPAQVEIEGKRPKTFISDVDTCWFHLRGFRSTSEKANSPLCVGDLVSKFRKAKGNWDETLYTALAIEGSQTY